MNLHGLEADRHLLRCLFSSVDLSESSAVSSSSSSKLAPLHGQALVEHYDNLLNRPSLLTAIGYVADKRIINQKVSCKKTLLFWFFVVLQEELVKTCFVTAKVASNQNFIIM